MLLLIKLICAHLAGDFLLQPASWVKDREEKKGRSLTLYLHAAMHGALAFLVVGEPSFWPFALAIAVTHALIDGAKATFQGKRHRWAWFAGDQLLHLAVLAAIWYDRLRIPLPFSLWYDRDAWLMVTAVLLLTLPASIAIRIFISEWQPDTNTREGESLEHAGLYIGILERLFVFAFVVAGHYEAIGFLLAAKSVFRFGDLKESRDRKLTEYVLIGTLLSFGIAFATGALVRRLLG